MAKFASIITLLFVALVLFVAFETPTMVGAKQSRPWERSVMDDGVEQSCHGNSCSTGSGTSGSKSCIRPSGTMRGVCRSNIACRNNCAKLERARHGSCNEYKHCLCYFAC